jgi:hypothetical protein
VTVNLAWASDGYRLAIDSSREHHLVRDSLVESAYIVDGLPDRECRARLGCSKAELQEAIDSWGQFEPLRAVSVSDLETIKSCFFETLDFFSESDYRIRTGWAKEESRLVLGKILADRRAITISRLWG